MAQSTHPAAYAKKPKRAVSPHPNPYAICQVVISEGSKAVFINAGIPEKYNQSRNTCPKCRMIEYKSGVEMAVAYAYTRNNKGHCDECEGDRIALIGMALEQQGIPLGWGVLEHTREYERESHQRHRAR